jgi:DNA-binding beta-propeller fold protein YncE
MWIDKEGFVWTTGRENHVVLKFTHDGQLAQVIGTYDVTNGSDDHDAMGRPAEIWYDDATHELFVADGYTNHRVVVYDGLTGRYLRHWGADGKPPCDLPRDQCPNLQYSTPHGIVGSRDGLIYVSDRQNSRVQVFDHMGNFKMQGITREGTGGAFSVALSPDPQQRFVYVTDGTQHRVWILRRSDMQVLGSFSEAGHLPGQMGRPHNITVDSKGNIYVSEGDPPELGNLVGQRAQKFVLKSMPPE